MTPLLRTLRAIAAQFSPTGWLTIGVLIGAGLLLGWCSLTAPGRERAKIDQAIAAANVEAQTRDMAAREVAADQRLADTLENIAMQKELTDAVQSLPDAVPSDRRRALACARLRRDPGNDPAAVAAVCGP